MGARGGYVLGVIMGAVAAGTDLSWWVVLIASFVVVGLIDATKPD